MKVSFQRDLMLSSFQSVASVVPTRTPKPILRNVLLSVDGNSTLLFATDTEIAVRMELQDVQELSNFFERRVSAYQMGVSGSVGFDEDF